MKDDTISRAAAISEVKKLCEGCYLSEHCGKCLTKCLVRKSINQLKKVPPSQPSATNTNVGGNLIDRQAALDALDKVAEMFPYRIPGKAKTYRQYNEAWSDAIDAAENALEALPPAQPSVSKTEIVEDTISRQAAIKAICEDGTMLERQGKYTMTMAERKQKDADILDSLPSAQPGWIPCTPETMPKMTDTYLVQVGINENGEGMHTEVRTADWNVVWHKWYVHTTRCFVGDIIKWMPIPWEGGKDEQN